MVIKLRYGFASDIQHKSSKYQCIEKCMLIPLFSFSIHTLVLLFIEIKQKHNLINMLFCYIQAWLYSVKNNNQDIHLET